ncbi:MAG: sigma-54-dependent Fis family transcriptional regulator [Candidatus Latescibacterota bacterium]|nr:MAG: sigma-54-dependent Fis family transcriptional regulator [Candidatus Latescibacterota bacterium]
MNRSHRVLVVEDQEAVRRGLEELLSEDGHRVATASDVESAVARALEFAPHLVLLDLNLPDKNGLELIRELRERGMDPTIIVLTAHASIDSAVDAVQRGVFDYLEKPVLPERLRAAVARGLERAELRGEVDRLRREMMRGGRFEEMIGSSPRMLELYRLVDQVAPTNAAVLILGESGTGKEVLARAVHRISPRASRPFVAVNCAAFPESLLESELFGHEKGAFTGATAARVGCFEQADTGTLFLDEIGEMPLEMQTKLLRVLEEKKVRRVGGSREVPIDVRILAASNRDLDALRAEGRFREDLFFRLNVFQLETPPLRERMTDLAALAEHFLRGFLEENPSRRTTGFSAEALAFLKAHSWPGNVRELRNVVQRAAVLCSEGEIRPEHLPRFGEAGRPATAPADDRDAVSIPVGSSLSRAERELILRTLRACEGNKPQAAKILGISLKTLYTRLHEYEAGSGGSSERDGPDRGGIR